MVTIRGVEFEANLDNAMGLKFHNLSHRWGFQCPNWPYFQDVKIERIHYMAKSGVLSQRITTSMHSTTHIDAPAHVVQGTPFIDEVPLPHFFGSGIVVSLPEEEVGVDHRRRPRTGLRQGDPPARRAHHQHGLAQGLRGRRLLCLLPRPCSVGRQSG